MELKMEVSAADLAVIGHVVADPAAWVAHAFEHVGAAAVRAKIDKWRPEYEAARAAQGADYKTRAVRQAEEDAALEAELARRAAEAKAEEEARLAAAVEAVLARRAKA